MILEQIDSVDLNGGAVSYKFFPVLFRRVGRRRGDHSKVLGAFIRTNVKKITTMFDVVFVIGLARDNCLPGGVGVIAGDIAKLGGSLAESFEQDHRFVSGALNANVKQLVFLVIDQFVLIRAQNVAKHFIVAFGDCIFSYVEKSFVVGGPGQVIDALDLLRQQFAGAQVLDLQCVLSITGVVG